MFVFSIHPRHVANILVGTKQYEYRTRRPSVKPGDTILIYETRPVSAVVGQATVTEVVDGCPCSTWQATSESGGVSSEEFFKYFGQRPRAVAIGLTDVVRFAEPVPLPKGMAAPQAWAKWQGEWVTPAQ